MADKKKRRGKTGAKYIKRSPLTKLTKKQAKLIDALPRVKTKQEAGEIAGYKHPSSTSQALRSKQVQEALEYLKIDPESVLSNFKRIANINLDKRLVKASDVLRANENLAKVVDIYPAQRVEKKELNVSMELRNADREVLSQKLEQLDQEIQQLTSSDATVTDS